MPENEFEKKVSSEMQDLGFKPSENVWLRVEERIKKKKKRRVFVIVFLLAGLSLLGYWQRNNFFGGNKNDIAITEEQKDGTTRSTTETNNTSTVKQNTETIKKEEANDLPEKIKEDKIKDDKPSVENKDIVVSKQKTNDPMKKETGIKTKPQTRKTKPDKNSGASVVVISSDPKKKSSIVDVDKTIDAPVVTTNTDPTIKQDQAKQAEIKPLENGTDSVKIKASEQEKKSTEKKDTVLKAEQVKESAKPIVKKDDPSKKWKWGAHITPGISSLSEHGFPVSSQNDYYRYAFASNQNSGSANPPTRQKPSDAKPGFAFQAGAFAQRQLSKRTSLSIGLQYGYYSHVLRIGTRRDSLLNNSQFASTLDDKANEVYNAGGDTIKYTNHYHFIELPLNFQWQLNKNNEKPFVWSAGITVGQLLSTNAIMYDTAFNGVYYQNKKLLNKTQFSLSTGFSWTIANSKKAQWTLGPVANIHLNKLMDNPFDNKGYLFFAGIRTAVLFNPKK